MRRPGQAEPPGVVAGGSAAAPLGGRDGAGGVSLTSRGTVLALLRKPRTLELLVFQRGRHGHLLGPVALGSHPRGLSRIRWNLRVAGQRLRAGTCTAELVAVFARGVTSDGPAVTFALTRAGLSWPRCAGGRP